MHVCVCMYIYACEAYLDPRRRAELLMNLMMLMKVSINACVCVYVDMPARRT